MALEAATCSASAFECRFARLGHCCIVDLGALCQSGLESSSVALVLVDQSLIMRGSEHVDLVVVLLRERLDGLGVLTLQRRDLCSVLGVDRLDGIVVLVSDRCDSSLVLLVSLCQRRSDKIRQVFGLHIGLVHLAHISMLFELSCQTAELVAQGTRLKGRSTMIER